MIQPPATMTAEELADLLGVNVRTVSELVRRNLVVRTDRDTYDMRASVRAYAASLRDSAAARATTGTLTAERERLTREKADHEAMRNAQTRRELVEASAVEALWASILRRLRARFLALPGRVQQRLSHLTAHDVAEIDREVRDCLTELGKYDEL